MTERRAEHSQAFQGGLRTSGNKPYSRSREALAAKFLSFA
jgi:hypothetical protein